MSKRTSQGSFTGRHMTAIMVGFFAVVVGVNLLMANFAIGTFGGVVVENSYVASQEFNGWLGKARASEALGWEAEVARRNDGKVAVRLVGAPDGTSLAGDARHPLGRLPDRPLAFARDASGAFVSNQPLPAGRWTLRLEARTVGAQWRDEVTVP